MINKKKNYFIWGNSGHANVIYCLLKKNKLNVKAILDDNIKSKKKFSKIKLIKGRSNIERWITQNSLNICGVVAIGDNKKRLEILNFLRKKNISLPSVVAKNSIVYESANIGPGVQILPGAVIGPNVKIEFGSIINHNAVVDHDVKICEGVHVAPSATICGNVYVSSGVLIGANSIVAPKSKIKKNTLVKAGSLYKKK